MAAYYVLLHFGAPPLAAAYTPVCIGLMFISFLEWRQPYRPSWKPDRHELLQDSFYMILVQILLAKFVTLLFVLTIANQSTPSQLWPHHLPLLTQVALMILIADFFRYWLHRLAHENKWLWRFHAVHHAPQKLHALNVGRFHPLEKPCQMIFDSLPFIFLGLSEEVLAGYFTFYAVNGFFQHCNIQLRLGWLNYVISGPELHRWHHSRLIRESNHNYGNNIILWDLLFRSYYAPKNRKVDHLGLINQHYPKDFFAQTRAAFAGDLHTIPAPLPSWGSLFMSGLIRLKMGWVFMRHILSLRAALRNPEAEQQRILRSILRRQRQTTIGRDAGFEGIVKVSEYQAALPVVDYEKLRDAINLQRETGEKTLNAMVPFLYNQTSGTTGEPKNIPITKDSLRCLKRSQAIMSYEIFKLCPEALSGRILGIVSPAIEGYFQDGSPFGSASGLLYKATPRVVRSRYVLPSEIFEIRDYDLKYRCIATLALSHCDISLMSSANPSTFIRLLETIQGQPEKLIQDIEKGSMAQNMGLPASVRTAFAKINPPKPQRAVELRRLLNQGLWTFEHIWPQLRVLATWTGGSCGIPLGTLRSQLSNHVKIFEIGYLASEFRGTIALAGDANRAIPTLQDHFFEFSPVSSYEADEPVFLGLHELQVGQDYYIIITTTAGLYRYDMNDIVRVTAMEGNTPCLSFLRKGKGATNITGEKLYENQVIGAMEELASTTSQTWRFYQVLASENDCLYKIYLEPANHNASLDPQILAQTLDDELKKINVEYKAKRDSGRLHALKLYLLPQGSFEAFKKSCLAEGQRENQFKTIALRYEKDVAFDFNKLLTEKEGHHGRYVYGT